MDEQQLDQELEMEEKKALAKKGKVGYSIASLVLGICAIVFGCCCTYLGIILGALAIGFSILYRSGSGAFDGKSMAGLICGIVGVVFAVISIIISQVFAEAYQQILDEYMKLLNMEGTVTYFTNLLR